ncbi:acyltransferase [Achromatium sp. WMS3]|nr:acyltransferase [Achromatium sp. WMS3]
MSTTKPKIAAIQMASGPHTAANLIETERLVTECVDAGAHLVILPENFSFMGKQERDLVALSETYGSGPLQDFLANLARKQGVWIVGGTVPLKGQNPDRVRAACLVFDAQGEYVARYDKLHLFDAHLVDANEDYKESAAIEAGENIVVIDSPCGRLGLAICYDLRFPELFRAMHKHQVEVVALPASFTALTGKAHWEILVRARAVENFAYIAAAAQGGYHISGRETYGHSRIVGPWGDILAGVAMGNGAISSALDLDYQATIRRNLPALQHRRVTCHS